MVRPVFVCLSDLTGSRGHIYAHLNKPISTTRFLFFDVSDSCNTIHQALLGEELTEMQIPPHILVYKIPACQTTVVLVTLYVRLSGHQYSDPTEDCPVIPFS